MIPVIIAATGKMVKSFTQCLSNISEKHDFKKLQKTAILGTAHTHTLRKVLMQFYKTFNMVSNITCRTNCKYRATSILYTLETGFVSGM